jgi:SAM-dependent methyltransferase
VQPTGSQLTQQQKDWEELAELDAHWAVASLPGRRFGRWDQKEFYARGERSVEEVIKTARELGHPKSFGAALDFGCGLGRLSRPLASHFQRVIGFDISQRMVAAATQEHRSATNCSFVANPQGDLRLFRDSSFDFIYAKLVLGHQPSTAVILHYITEFVRLLSPGGLVTFGVPSAIPLHHRLQLQRRLYAVLRRIAIPSRFLYNRLGLHSIRLRAVPEAEIEKALEASGARLLRVESTRAKGGVRNATYYATK